ncbi:MAG TPA: hypothetical protein VHE53_01225 [Patescibacteria group bacterium]|nr:hypothetical protein [Patescibacteria group bacterium]
MPEYLKHEFTAEPLDIESEKARLRNFKGDYPDTNLPRYKPGDKIIGSLPYPRSIENPIPNLQGQSDQTDPATQVVDIVWQSLRSQYGEPGIVGLDEYPKPEKIKTILAIANDAINKIYPGLRTIESDQVLWMSESGVTTLAHEVGQSTPTQDRLRELGWKPEETTNEYFETDENPNRLVFLKENYVNIDNDDEPWLKISPECSMVYNIILGTIEQSRIRRFTPYTDETRRIFSRVLDNDTRTIPKANPGIDMQGFKDLVRQYRKMLDDKSRILVHAHGATINLAYKMDPEDYSSYQTIMATGVKLSAGITHHLGRAPLKIALDAIVDLYPPEVRMGAIKSTDWYFKQNETLSRGIKSTTESYGIKTNQEILTAYSDGSILERYEEAKKKRKSLEYSE